MNEPFEKDSLNEVTEFQNHQYDLGYYVGTGRVPPTVSAPGNATPLVVVCFLGAAIFLAFGLFLFFSDATVTSSGLIQSAIVNKIIALVIMLGIAVFFSAFGFFYLAKAKRYYHQKAVMEDEPIDDTVEDKLWQRTCPNCGDTHDIDYPKCPKCKFRYTE